jgi:serine/threonine-protein kinase
VDELKGRRIGRFEVQRKLGAGGMGEVYAARDSQLRRDVALKRLPPAREDREEWRQRLLREARSAARITNQHVAALYDVVEEEDALYLVMELVDGTTLRGVAAPLEGDEFLDVAKQCAVALSAAHRQGVVHGDIKPDNIMISDAGEVKVLDFGVAGMMIPTGGDATTAFDTLAVVPGTAGHTLAYAAPEVLKGASADSRADLFSLGIVFHELLTGEHPFAAETNTAAAGRILHEAAPRLGDVTSGAEPDLERILAKLLAKLPRDRYATADDLLVDLRSARTHHATGHAMAQRAWRARPVGMPGWRGFAAGFAVVALLTSPMWSRYLPWGPAGAPVGGPAGEIGAAGGIIAVIPAAYGEEERELHLLNDGLASTLTAGLTRLSVSHDMEVIPASALHDLGEVTADAVRREFGITLALTFDTQRFGDRVRVNAALVDVAGRRQLAAETIDGDTDDLLGLQEQVSRRVLRMLQLELRPMEQDLLRSGTTESRAYGYYLRGRGYLESPGAASQAGSAIELFEQALRVDAEFPAAHAGLGEALRLQYLRTQDAAWLEQAADACLRATQLDTLAATGHVCLGKVRLSNGLYDEAVVEFVRAVELDPTQGDALAGLASAYTRLNRLPEAEQAYLDAIAIRPHFWQGYRDLGTFYYRTGRFDDGIANLEEFAQLAPDSYRAFSTLGAAYYQVERWTDARRAFERALELNPEHAGSWSNLGTLLYYEGDYDASVDSFERAIELRPDYYLYRGNLGESLYFLEGRTARTLEALGGAIRLVDDALEVNPADAWALADVSLYRALLGEAGSAATMEQAIAAEPGDPEMLLVGAKVQAVLGEDAAALALLEQAVAGGIAGRIVGREPAFERLRDDPRMQALVAPVRDPN